MRIDPNQGSQISESRLSASPQSPGSNSAAARAGADQDQAQLSGAHALVQALAAEASQLPEVREEKVSALRQAVESGTYQPDSQKVAGALVSTLLIARAA